MGKRPTNPDIGLPGVLLQRRKAVNIILLGILLAGFTVSCGKPDDPSGQKEAYQEENVLSV